MTERFSSDDGRIYRGGDLFLDLVKKGMHVSAPAIEGSLEYTAGDILEKYELGEQIANMENGGQATVYLARRKEDGLEVAAKIYGASEKVTDWNEIINEEKRSGREIRFLERANREGIRGVPKLVEYGATGSFIKSPVAIMQRLPGRTLEEEVMGNDYNPSMELVLGIAKDVSEVLEYAHHSSGVKPVVHRDINPGNIFVNGETVLADWAASTPTSGATQFRTQMYTQYFTAPEILEGKEFDGRADIYGLGQTLRFMLLGKEFKEKSGMPLRKDFESLNISEKVIDVLDKATSFDPKARYRTAREFYESLEAAVKGSSLPAHDLGKASPGFYTAVVKNHSKKMTAGEKAAIRRYVKEEAKRNHDVRQLIDAGGLMNLVRDIKKHFPAEERNERLKGLESSLGLGDAYSFPDKGMYGSILEAFAYEMTNFMISRTSVRDVDRNLRKAGVFSQAQSEKEFTSMMTAQLLGGVQPLMPFPNLEGKVELEDYERTEATGRAVSYSGFVGIASLLAATIFESSTGQPLPPEVKVAAFFMPSAAAYLPFKEHFLRRARNIKRIALNMPEEKGLVRKLAIGVISFLDVVGRATSLK